MKKVLVPLIFLAFLIVSCGDDGAKEEKIEPICLTPKAGPYELKFTDISEEMGVQTLNALGTQITVADIDGDKWPDVYTTLASKVREDQNEPQNLYKLLKNVKGKNFEDITFSSGLFALPRRPGAKTPPPFHTRPAGRQNVFRARTCSGGSDVI